MRRLHVLIGLFGLSCLSGIAADEGYGPWSTVVLPRVELSAEANALNRWRSHYPLLFPENPSVRDHLLRLSSPLESVIHPLPPEVADWLATRAAVLNELVLREGEWVQFPPIYGPETPFPDHQPLSQLARLRVVALKAAWAEGRKEAAVQLALENLKLSRVMLLAQEGVVPVLAASGIWQESLDGVYWLARQSELSPALAARLQLALLGDERLAADALIRAFRGEFTFFTLATIDRLPKTRDVELYLSSIGSLALAPAEAPMEGTPRLAIPERDLFDREATLQAAADDVQDWLRVLQAAPRHPRGFTMTHTHRRLGAYAQEIRSFLTYAVQDVEPTPEQALAVDAEITRLENPVGKLFLIITTTQREMVSASVFRREAQRSALTALLAWRRFERPASWTTLVTSGLLADAASDPFTTTSLRMSLDPPRVWSAGEDGADEGGHGDGENLGRSADLVWPLR